MGDTDIATAFWDLTASDWLSALIGFLGIVVAVFLSVLITPWLMEKTARRDQREATFRQLLSSMNDAGSFEYSEAITLISVDFKGVRNVQAAKSAFLTATNEQMSDDPEKLKAQVSRITETQASLVEAIARNLGYHDITAEYVLRNNYNAIGLANRVELENRKAKALEGILSEIQASKKTSSS